MHASIRLARDAREHIDHLVAHPTGTELGLLTSGLPAPFTLAGERVRLRDEDITGIGHWLLRGAGLHVPFTLAGEQVCLRDVDLTGISHWLLRGPHLTVGAHAVQCEERAYCWGGAPKDCIEVNRPA